MVEDEPVGYVTSLFKELNSALYWKLLVNTDTDGSCNSVRINRVFVLSRLILEKMYDLLFRWDKKNFPLYTSVRIKLVSEDTW